ncbi:tyrosine recombinase [Bacteroidota bacterium]|nr:tyrosine recombinase [Bacteroidota bacterium]
MIKVAPILYTYKTLSNGEHPIMIRLTLKGKRRYIGLGVNCKANYWDDINNLPSKKHPHQKELIILINDLVNSISKKIYTAENSNTVLTLDELANSILNIAIAPTQSLSAFIDQLCEKLKENGKIETHNIFRSTKNTWLKFFKKDSFYFDDINSNSIHDFEKAGEKKGNMPSTTFLYLRTLKTIINMAKKERICNPEYNPFQEYSFAKFRRIKTRKRAISREDFRKIEDLEIDEKSRLFHSRNYFIFSFYAGGINFVDLAQLKWAHIEKTQLYYTRKKTNELINVPLVGQAIKILEIYKRYSNCKKDDFIFPILSEIHATSISITNRLHKVNHQINQDLQQIGETLKLDVKLTTYVARHTFATVLKKEGISVSIIGQALGHEDEKTTRIYLDSFGSDIMQQAFEKLS